MRTHWGSGWAWIRPGGSLEQELDLRTVQMHDSTESAPDPGTAGDPKRMIKTVPDADVFISFAPAVQPFPT